MPRHLPAWHVKAEYREHLSPAVLNRLINREGVRHALTRRELPSRTVTRLEPASPELPPLYLKEYRFPTFMSRMKYIFRSPADREWRTAHRIAQRGIPTFEPLAVGTRRRFGLPVASYLISREIEHARPLKDYLLDRECRDDQAGWAIRQSILRSLASFVREVHRRGILHRDFHWGNILIDTRDAKNILCYLMDLHRVRLKRRLRDRERVTNLASIGTAFRLTARTTERLRFLVQYARDDERWGKRLQHFARGIENRSERMLKKIWTRKARRCLKHNKYFIPFRAPGCRGFLRGEFSSPALLELLQEPGHAFSAPGSIIIKHSNTTSSCTLQLIMAGEPASIFIKRYNYQNMPYALKYLFRRSRGKRSWQTAHALLARDIPTPLPVAYAEKRRARALRESFFISCNVGKAVPLSRLLGEAATGMAAGHLADTKGLIRRAALLVRTMHARGIWHRDLKAANILVQRIADNDTKLFLTDLDSIRIKDTVRPEERIRDLARLNRSLIRSPDLSARDRLRFLQCYLGASTRGDKTLRAYWEAIRSDTAKKLAKNI